MRRAMIDFGLLLTRAAVGLYFLLAGVPKAQTEVREGLGTFAASDAFRGLQPAWLPDAFATPFGYVLPWAEVAFGALLVVGVLTPLTAAVVFLMVASFTIALATAQGSLAAVGSAEPYPFHPNYVIAAAAFLLVFTGGGRLSVDRIAFGKAKTRVSA